jgi:predicted nucleic acid-binding protein
MIFTDLPAGASVFVDANTVVYRFSLHPQFGPACIELFERIERQDLVGYLTAPILSEAGHRMMTLEAVTRFHWPQANIGNRLRHNPAEVRKLVDFRAAIDRLLQSKLRFLPTDPPMLGMAAAMSQQIGLLMNDALVVAVMQTNGLTNIASGDTDFDRVPGVTRYGPT